MTFTTFMDIMSDTKPKKTTIGGAMKEVLVQAIDQGRAHFGVFECVDLLDREMDSVMMCILPEGTSQDVSLRIQHTLIEAYCREHEIKVLKTDSVTKVSAIYTSTVSKDAKATERVHPDFSCVIVMAPALLSPEDEFVTDYCENFILGGLVPHGHIEVLV